MGKKKSGKVLRPLTLLGILCWCSWNQAALANWTLNLGYHNPQGSRLGLNFLYWGSQWNFELGIGWLDAVVDDGTANSDSNRNIQTEIIGEFDIKYRFTTGGFAPYMQAGIGAYSGVAVGEQSGAFLNVGEPFLGLGLMLGQAQFHGYVAADYFLQSRLSQWQCGIGFDI